MTFINSNNTSIDIPAGDASGFSSELVVGRTTNLDRNKDTDIWDGAIDKANNIFVPPTAARVHDIASSSANDSSTGTGMRTLRIYGLDANWLEVTEDITLNGTTNVSTVNSYVRINKMKGLTWGSSLENEGDITATAQVDGTVTARINNVDGGYNQTLSSLYSVPSNKVGLITNIFSVINISSANKTIFDLHLLIKENADLSTSGYLLSHAMGVYINNNIHEHTITPYLKVQSKSDIVLRGVNCTDKDSDITAGYGLILKDI